MSLNLDELDPDSPEFEAAVEAAQAVEDAEREGAGQATEDDEGGTDDAAAPQSDEQPAATVTTPEKPAPAASGVMSKDGKTVLPFAVVQSARRERAAERDARMAAEAESAQLRQQLEDLRAGKKPTSGGDDDLEAEIAEAAADFPLLGKLYEQNKALRNEVNAMAAKRAPEADTDTGAAEKSPADALQDDIDSVPALATWQAMDPEKFERARAIDVAMHGSPKWRDKPRAERFAHVARQVAAEFDIQIDEPPAPSRTTTPGRSDPRDVIANVARAAPNTLSDFKNGAPDVGEERLERMPVQRQVARMADMSDDEIDAYLAKTGG